MFIFEGRRNLTTVFSSDMHLFSLNIYKHFFKQTLKIQSLGLGFFFFSFENKLPSALVV